LERISDKLFNGLSSFFLGQSFARKSHHFTSISSPILHIFPKHSSTVTPFEIDVSVSRRYKSAFPYY